jgi:hypothetical protein
MLIYRFRLILASFCFALAVEANAPMPFVWFVYLWFVIYAACRIGPVRLWNMIRDTTRYLLNAVVSPLEAARFRRASRVRGTYRISVPRAMFHAALRCAAGRRRPWYRRPKPLMIAALEASIWPDLDQELARAESATRLLQSTAKLDAAFRKRLRDAERTSHWASRELAKAALNPDVVRQLRKCGVVTGLGMEQTPDGPKIVVSLSSESNPSPVHNLPNLPVAEAWIKQYAAEQELEQAWITYARTTFPTRLERDRVRGDVQAMTDRIGATRMYLESTYGPAPFPAPPQAPSK